MILFEGGLALKFDDLRDAGGPVRRMVFFGGPLALVLGALAAHYVAGLDWASAIVFASVLIVTGPTVIMPLLRQSKLGGRTGAALKWEGIINDPIGALLAVAAFEVVRVANTGDSAIAITRMDHLRCSLWRRSRHRLRMGHGPRIPQWLDT